MVDIGEEEILPMCEDVIRKGGTFHAKFTCKHCGARQTFEEANSIFASGHCEECDKVSQLDKWGLLIVYAPMLKI